MIRFVSKNVKALVFCPNIYCKHALKKAELFFKLYWAGSEFISHDFIAHERLFQRLAHLGVKD
jgi:hypothetical protein